MRRSPGSTPHLLFYSVYNQVRGFKTRHADSHGVGGGSSSALGSATGSSSRNFNEFDGYRLAAGGSGRPTSYPQDPNQPPLTAFVNRVSGVVGRSLYTSFRSVHTVRAR
jgi:hypothetical protein